MSYNSHSFAPNRNFFSAIHSFCFGCFPKKKVCDRKKICQPSSLPILFIATFFMTRRGMFPGQLSFRRICHRRGERYRFGRGSLEQTEVLSGRLLTLKSSSKATKNGWPLVMFRHSKKAVSWHAAASCFPQDATIAAISTALNYTVVWKSLRHTAVHSTSYLR